MPEVVEINRLDDIDRYQLLWTSLLGETPNATFFHSLDWLRAHLSTAEDQSLRVYVVFSRGKAIGIVPFVRRRSDSFLGKVHSLGLPIHDWCAHIGPVGPNPTASLVAALKHVRKDPQRDWDTLDLSITDPPFDFERMATSLEVAGFPVQTSQQASSGIIHLGDSWCDYLAQRPPGFATRLSRLHDRLPQLGSTRFVRYRPLGEAHGDSDPRWDIFHDCIELARQHWHGRTRSGALIVNQASVEFLNRLHQVATHSGSSDLNILMVDNKPAAFFYNVHRQGQIQCVCWSADPQYTKFGIDRILLSHMSQDSFERGDAWIDIGRDGSGRWRPWTNKVAVTRRFVHYPRTVAKAQALRLGRWMQERFTGKANPRHVPFARQATSQL